jgi:hypothetical protein
MNIKRLPKLPALPKIAEIEKQRLLASDGEGESKYPKGVCVTTPLKQLVSEELP